MPAYLQNTQRLQSDLPFRYIPNEQNHFRTINGREVENNSRHCLNCTRCSECWNNEVVEHHPITAAGFIVRSSWSYERFMVYLKEITGNLCGSFTHSDPVIDERMRRNETVRINNNPNREWEV